MEVVDPTRPQRAAVAAVAATLLVIGLTAAGAPAPDPSATTPAVADAVHEPRVTASGTAIPLPRDSAVVVVDVAGVEHARLLATALGPTAVALDVAALGLPTSDLPILGLSTPDVRCRPRTRPWAPPPRAPARTDATGADVPAAPHADGLQTLLRDETLAPGGLAAAVVVVDRHRDGGDRRTCASAVDAAGLAARFAERHPVTVLVVDEPPVAPVGPVAPPAPPAPPSGDVPPPVAPTVVQVLEPALDDAALAAVLRGAATAAPPADPPEPAPPADPPEPAPSSVQSPSTPLPTPVPVPAPTCRAEPDPAPADATPTAPTPTAPTPTAPTPTAPTPADPGEAPADPPASPAAGTSPATARPSAPTTPWRLPARAAAPGLALAVDGAGVHLSDAVDAEDRWRLSGLLTGVRVVDARTAQPGRGWTLAAQVSDLTGPATLPADRIGWVPQVGDARAAAGPAVAGTLSGGPGLAVPALLASADRATSGDPVELDAQLVLETPRDTPPGTYSGTLTLTLFPEE